MSNNIIENSDYLLQEAEKYLDKRYGSSYAFHNIETTIKLASLYALCSIAERMVWIKGAKND